MTTRPLHHTIPAQLLALLLGATSDEDGRVILVEDGVGAVVSGVRTSARRRGRSAATRWLPGAG